MNAFVKGAVAKSGIYEISKKIGVNSATLARYIAGLRVYGPSLERIEKWGASKGRWKPPSTTTKNDKKRLADKAKVEVGKKRRPRKTTAKKKAAPKVVKKAPKKVVAAKKPKVRQPKKAKRPALQGLRVPAKAKVKATPEITIKKGSPKKTKAPAKGPAAAPPADVPSMLTPKAAE